jgi:hypothetical protein
VKTYKCIECGKECELIEKDDGGYEEFWGAKVWHEQMTDYSDCCCAEYEEVEDDE